jgi:two-component system, OmpR family, phosphate regulon response regulator OmpR
MNGEPQHLLIVDDDRRIRELIKGFLADNGFLISTAASAAEARDQMRGLEFDLIVLDIMMKGETGLEFARALRADGNEVPVLMLSALAETEDRINGLATGSDDYLVKPFEPRELLLRIQSILRRRAVVREPLAEVRFGSCVFHIERGELRRDGAMVKLTLSERELLRALAQKAGEPVARADLMQPGAEETARSVDVQINRLRRKIEANPAQPLFLQTVRGAGYVLLAD